MSKLSTSMLFIILLAVLTVFLAIGLIACYSKLGLLSIASVADLAQIGGSIAVVGSLLFIAAQLRQQATQLQLQTTQLQQQATQLQLQTTQLQQQTSLAKASNSQSLVNTSSSFVLAIGGDPVLMNLYQSGGERYEKLSSEEQAQYSYLVGWWLTFYENVVYQEEIQFLDLGVYEAWMNDMKGFIRRRRVEKVWDSLKDNYSASFIKKFQPQIDARRLEP